MQVCKKSRSYQRSWSCLCHGVLLQQLSKKFCFMVQSHSFKMLSCSSFQLPHFAACFSHIVVRSSEVKACRNSCCAVSNSLLHGVLFTHQYHLRYFMPPLCESSITRRYQSSFECQRVSYLIRTHSGRERIEGKRRWQEDWRWPAGSVPLNVLPKCWEIREKQTQEVVGRHIVWGSVGHNCHFLRNDKLTEVTQFQLCQVVGICIAGRNHEPQGKSYLHERSCNEVFGALQISHSFNKNMRKGLSLSLHNGPSNSHPSTRHCSLQTVPRKRSRACFCDPRFKEVCWISASPSGPSRTERQVVAPRQYHAK